MSIPSWYQLFPTSILPFSHWAGAGLINWQSLQVCIIDLTIASVVEWRILWHKYVVCLMPGCPHCWCIVRIRSGVNWTVRAAHIRGGELDLCLINSNHFFGTRVSSSAKFCSNAMKVTSTWRPYSQISCCRIVNLFQTSILLAALVPTRALPVSVSVSQW